MEIATLVCNNGLNYDLAFQTYAMFGYLKKQGNQVQVIDYNFFKKNNKKNEMLYNFLASNVVLTFKRYNDINYLEENLPLADKFIVLNGEYKELSIPLNGDKNVAYGMKTSLSESIEISNNFSKVSTFYDAKNKKINRVVDPIFLLKRDEWYDLMDEEQVINMPIDYILIYGEKVTKEMLNYANKIASNNNSKIIIVADNVKSLFYKGKRIKNVEPFELLKLIASAQDVITSCNDGIKFSIVFEKNLHIFLTDDENQIELINDFNLKKRVVNESNKIVLQNISYNDSYDKIYKLVDDSTKFLNE